SSRRLHTRFSRDWSSDVCSSDLVVQPGDRVLVTGPGAMGQLSAQVAKASGGVVTLAGLPADAERLAVASELGIRTTTERPEEDRSEERRGEKEGCGGGEREVDTC